MVANQEREKAGLSNPVEHDTEAAIRAGIDALRKLIAEDKNTSNWGFDFDSAAG